MTDERRTYSATDVQVAKQLAAQTEQIKGLSESIKSVAEDVREIRDRPRVHPAEIARCQLDCKRAIDAHGEAIQKLTDKFYGVPGLGEGIDDGLNDAKNAIRAQTKRVDRILVELDVLVGAAVAGLVTLGILLLTGQIHIHG